MQVKSIVDLNMPRIRQLTEAAVTPSIFWTAASILAAQLAQSRSTSLNVFFIFNTPQNF